ncbi:unnamed protein product (macronuclear) [Paramecium tetraurelia]|uniref:Transmembrane protein n=1 Tax=Paramecium tetraurelia TaxID=5888 RepID=A0BZU5_PARTE|nr:uncharacterized protein GSPATT00005914001 [Paramecium tetraurelia]CAK64062.1 unnamed protein product [Paramecium tetraurelia]|eukprot:XP_001431460.1 hypothetical protein (macronuclear) [Paramecium tetraurelia strain d4-2]
MQVLTQIIRMQGLCTMYHLMSKINKLSMQQKLQHYHNQFKKNLQWTIKIMKDFGQLNTCTLKGIKQQNGFQQKQISSDYFTQNQFLLIQGGSLKIFDTILSQTLLLSSFPGSLTFFLQEDLSILEDINFIEKCFPQQNDQLSDYFSNEEGKYTEFQTENEYVNSFFLQFWMKIIPSKLSLNHILRLSINKSSKFIGQIGSNSVVINYEYMLEDLFYYVEYYSYEFPIANPSQQNPYKKFVQDSISIEFITNWHLIQVKYLDKQLMVQLESFILKVQKIKIFDDVNQFTNTKMKIYFGGNQYEISNNKIEIASVIYENCLDKNQQIQYCHYSCKTCFGPFRSQCLSCSDYQNRIYDPIKKSCNCQLWYYENQADHTCIGQEQKQYIETIEYLKNDPRYDENEQFRTCAFGYFLYKDECIQCPAASQKNIIFCINCLMDPDNWIYSGFCFSQYLEQPGIENAVYEEFRSTKFDPQKLFILIDNELSSCGFCSSCTLNEYNNDRCFLYPFKHLDQPYYIQCSFGYDEETYQCKFDSDPYFFKVCAENCGACDFFGECNYCINPTEYFFTWERKCRQCKVKNCKYCFQYNRYDHSQVSVNSDIAQVLISKNEEDYIMACALCNQGYVFNFQINECVLQQITYPCINGYINENSQFLCTNTQGIFNQLENNLVSEFHDCLKYFLNCMSCIQDSFRMMYCISCIDGYYLDYHNGLCISCEGQFPNSSKCGIETSTYDSWKYELVSFFLNFIPNSTPLQVIGLYYRTDYQLLECKKDYTIYSRTCIPKLETKCLVWNRSGACSKCQNLDQENDAQSFFENRCQICPYPCRFCLPISDSKINEINPYFIINSDSKAQTYQCLLNLNQKETFIYQYIGQQMPKDTNNKKLLRTIQQPVFPNSPVSNAQGYIDLEYLKRRKVTTYIDNYNAFRKEDPVNLRSVLFFLLNSTVLYDGYNDTFHEKQISIFNQTTVSLQNVRFFSSKNHIIISSLLGVNIYIHNITLHNQVRNSPILTIKNFTHIIISKLEVYDLTLSDASLINLNKDDNLTKFYPFVIQEIVLKNCVFKNSSFIYLSSKFQSIGQFIINNIIIDNCSFENFELIKLEGQFIVVQKFVLENIKIMNSSLTNSLFLVIQNTNFSLLSGIILQDCKLSKTTLISLNPYSILKKISFLNAYLDNSVFLLYTETIKPAYIHKIDDIYMENIFICGMNLIKISQSLHETSSIEMSKITLSQIYFNCPLQNVMPEKSTICIFDLSSNKIDLSLLRNDQINNYWILCINNSNFFKIDDILLNSYQVFSSDSNENTTKSSLGPLNSGLLQLKQVLTATFSNIIIRSQSLIDSSIIYINSKNEQQIKTQSLSFSNIVFENNLLIKTQSFSQTTLLYLEFEDKCIISISDITFTQNYVIHQIFDCFTISPSLICIITQSLAQLKNAIFKENEYVNSCFSSLYIKSSEIQMEFIKAKGINVFDFDLTRYLSSNNSFNSGGFSHLYGSQIAITNSNFENALVQETAYFNIYLQNEGNMIINNTTISGIIVSTKLDNNYNEALFVIDSTNSNLNIDINNMQISNILSRYTSGIFKINPSKIKNQLRLNNIFVENVLSKQQYFLDLICTNNVDNSVEISDFSLTLEKSYFRKYHEFVYIDDNPNQLSQIDIQGMIVITNSSIIFSRLHFTGFAPITILCLEDTPKIMINHLVFEQIEVATQKLNIIIHEYSGNQSKIINMYLSQLVIKDTYKNAYIHVESFFEIQQSFPKKLILRDFLIANNTCQTCQNGLICFNQIKKLFLSNLIFYQNHCGLLSCLMLNHVNQSTIFKKSRFIKNSGTQGGAINVKAGKIEMKNILFMQNDAESGGALYSQSSSMKLETLISELYLIQNTATFGGAIYLENHNFRAEELLKVFLLENKGKRYVDNIKENPSQLKLSIFNQELDTKSIANMGQPNFEKYKLNTNIIYIPSGQQISNYSIQDLERQVFENYNLNPKLYAINNLGEKQINLQEYQCVLNQLNNESQFYPNQEQIISFNLESQSFDFSNLIISLDPYLKSETIFVFDCNCFTESQYKFYLSVKSFPCQIGEFYYFTQCMKCDESKGFYSVELGATFCQKMDPNIIQANTASEILLQPGFWRPNYRSKFINKCTRQKNLCLGGWKPGDESCSLGYIGALCEECDIYNIKGDGQYFKNRNNKCVFCSEFGLSIFISLLFGSLTIGSMILTVSSVNTIFKSFLKFKLTSKHYKILFNHSLDQSAALIKTVVNYFQILVRIKSFHLELFFNIIDILTPLSNPIGTQSYSYECTLSQQTELQIIYISLIINLLAPIFFYFIFLTIYLILIQKKMLKLTPTIYATAIFYLFFYAQPNIILELGELITARNISEISYINRNVSILYFTNTHISWVLFFITPILFIIGIIIPLILFLILYNKRYNLNQEKVRKIWGYIFNDYKESSFYWEIFRVSEREILLLSLIIFEEQIEIKVILTFLILFLYHIIVLNKKPFNMETLNRFEQKCITLSSLIFLICGIKYQIQILQIPSIDFILQTLLLIVFIMFFYILINQTISTYYQKYTDRLDGIRKGLLQRFPKILKICPFLRNYLKIRGDIKIKLKTRVKLIKEALHMNKGENIMQNQHQNLLSYSLQKSIYPEEQALNFQNLQTNQKNNEKEKSHFVKDLVPFY